MKDQMDFQIPARDEFLTGCEIYNEKEKKGPIYFQAVGVVSDNWSDNIGIAKGISIIIRGWNFLYANFNFNDLINCVSRNRNLLSDFRDRNILNLSENDFVPMTILFNDFLEVLKREKDGAKSPVSVAKALNPLAPDYFPIWDSSIAEAYKCGFIGYGPENAASIYMRFCRKMKFMASQVKDYIPGPDDRSLLKRIDEYNYAKYTKYWI
jgi:hypothetical protein